MLCIIHTYIHAMYNACTVRNISSSSEISFCHHGPVADPEMSELGLGIGIAESRLVE